MWLLYTKGYGFAVKDIDSSCPADLEPYAEAYKLEMKQRDTEMWSWFGNYGISAFGVAIDNCFSKNAKSEYIKNPIMKERKKEPAYKESNEEIAIWEMKQRIKALREQGLPESPD